MKSRVTAFSIAGIVLCVAAWAQSTRPITNADVVQMVHDGLPTEVILAKIGSAPCQFDSSTAGLVSLTDSKIAPNVVAAVAARNCASAATLVPASSTAAVAPDPPLRGSKVYIAPMDGFEIYLAAAFREKKVPMTVVTNKAEASYIIQGTSESQKAGWGRILLKGQTGSAETASVQLADLAGNVLWGYSVNKGNSVHGKQSTAEACAKHLKSEIEKREKKAERAH